MNRIIWIALLFCLTTPSFANQTFIKGGFLLRGKDYPKLRGLGVGVIHAFDVHLGPIHPEASATAWLANESDVYYPGSDFRFEASRLDDTFTATNRTQSQGGIHGTARVALDMSDSMRATGAKVWPVLGIGVGGYQLFREEFPAREAGIIAEFFFRLHFALGKTADTVLEFNAVTSMDLKEHDEILDTYPDFAFVQISLGFELPVRQNVRTTH